MEDEAPETIEARADSLADAIEDLKSDLVALRERHGLTQPDVARRLGMSQSAVSQFESHDANPTLRTLRRYALAVGARLKIDVIDDYATTTTSIENVNFVFQAPRAQSYILRDPTMEVVRA